MSAPRTQAVALLGAAFALGLIVGIAGLSIAARSGKASWLLRSGHRSSSFNAGYSGILERRLHIKLAPNERDSINAVSCRHQVVMDSIRQSLNHPVDSLFHLIQPAVETERTQMRQEIRALLTETERPRYDSLLRANDDQRRRMHDQGSPPPNSGGNPCANPGGPSPRGGPNRG